MTRMFESKQTIGRDCYRKASYTKTIRCIQRYIVKGLFLRRRLSPAWIKNETVSPCTNQEWNSVSRIWFLNL